MESSVGINEKLSLRQLMFGFDGRIGRCGFLKYTGILCISLFIGFVLCSALVDELVVVLQPAKVSAISIMCAIGAWPAAAIICKRLHDMDRSGFHSMWICPLFFLPLGWMPPSWAMADIGALSTVLSWLALAPGTIGPNVHGLKGGMRVDRIIDTPRTDNAVGKVQAFQEQAAE